MKMDSLLKEFTEELKALIIKYGLSFSEVQRSLAILDGEKQEAKNKSRMQGKK